MKESGGVFPVFSSNWESILLVSSLERLLMVSSTSFIDDESFIFPNSSGTKEERLSLILSRGRKPYIAVKSERAMTASVLSESSG